MTVIEGSSFTDLLIPLVRYRWRILLVMALIVAFGGYRYLVMPPKYAAHVSLVALIGAEYGLRADAGLPVSNGSAFDGEQIMTTETQLLKNAELEMAVVREVGLATLYPAYLGERSGLRAILYGARETLYQRLRDV